ncbi:MAG: hypothetical protein CL569_02985 [Alphaproteobacteria bacterium]|nr:hypothetical protein [Alphaproteobacteria bacterium]
MNGVAPAAKCDISRPAKVQPWYHVLVHGAEHTTYVAQRNLEPDETGEPVNHPLIEEIFGVHENGVYLSRKTLSWPVALRIRFATPRPTRGQTLPP